MLAGAYPCDEFAELKPRVTWDRVTDVIDGRRDARVVAVTSGGTIPDRGLFGVFMVGEAGTPGRRVGELDEEMVYESRAGEVITLGASSWRIEEIGHDRVTVSPAPGVPGKLPFWHGDAVGRPIELGRALGAFVREAEADLGRGRREADGRPSTACKADHDLDELAAENLVAYLEDEREVVGALPTDRRIVVERFRDELGDWRLVLLTPFGGRVHAPWSLALEARLGEKLGDRGPDDLVRRRDRDPPARRRDAVRARSSRSSSRSPTSSRSSSSARSRAARCSPRASARTRRGRSSCRAAGPGTRTPLWQQRQRAADLLAVASPLRQLPDPRRDVPRGPLGRLRPAGAARGARRRRRAARSPIHRVETLAGQPVRELAPVRLRRRLHVRRRRAAGRAPGRAR